jgi:hypothetical protein
VISRITGHLPSPCPNRTRGADSRSGAQGTPRLGFGLLGTGLTPKSRPCAVSGRLRGGPAPGNPPEFVTIAGRMVVWTRRLRPGPGGENAASGPRRPPRPRATPARPRPARPAPSGPPRRRGRRGAGTGPRPQPTGTGRWPCPYDAGHQGKLAWRAPVTAFSRLRST